MYATDRLNTALAGRYRIEREPGARALGLNQPTRVLRSEPFEELDVGEILRTTRLAFVFDEVFS